MKINKKLAKVTLAAFVGIAAPGWGAEKIELFDDGNLTNLSFKSVLQLQDGTYQAKIAGTANNGDTEFRRLPVSAVQFISWENHDNQRFALKKIQAILDCKSGNDLTGVFTLPQEYP